MNDLRELIGLEGNVEVNYFDSKDVIQSIDVRCKIIDVNIDTWHFEESYCEPIYITIDVEPINDIPELEYEDPEDIFEGISLDNFLND